MKAPNHLNLGIMLGRSYFFNSWHGRSNHYNFMFSSGPRRKISHAWAVSITPTFHFSIFYVALWLSFYLTHTHSPCNSFRLSPITLSPITLSLLFLLFYFKSYNVYNLYFTYPILNIYIYIWNLLGEIY